MVKKADIPRHIVDSALKLAADQGWRDTSLGDIAEAAKLPLGAVLALYPSKISIVAAYSRRIDDQVLKSDDPELIGEPPRDRLFDVMMRRFDALSPHRDAVRSIVSASLRDPVSAFCAAFILRRSMRLMLEAARIGASGLPGVVRVKGLAAIYLTVLRVWFNDGSEGMSETMSALDKALRRAEFIVGLCRFPSPRRSATEPEAEAGTA